MASEGGLAVVGVLLGPERRVLLDEALQDRVVVCRGEPGDGGMARLAGAVRHCLPISRFDGDGEA